MENTQEVMSNLNYLFESGQYEELLNQSERFLTEDPRFPALHVFKGDALRALSRPEEALDAYREAILLDPNDALARTNYASLLFDQKDYANALNASDSAIFIDPAFTDPYIVSGNVLSALGYADQAVFAYHRAFSLDEGNKELGEYVAELYTEQQMLDQAMPVYFTLAEKEPDNAALQLKIGGALLFSLQNGASFDAVSQYASTWEKTFNNNSLIHSFAEEIKTNNVNYNPLTVEHLTAFFDTFAADYDTAMMGEGYAIPDLLKEAMEKNFSNRTDLEILDVGCGTGLCGIVVKPYSASEGLYGVDLSSKMLDLAYDKKIYDKVFNGDFVSYFAQNDRKYDLILAGDVLPYNADFAAALSSIKTGLKDKGYLMFSLRLNQFNEEEAVFYPPFNEIFNKTAVERILKENGFILVSETPVDEEGQNLKAPEYFYVVQKIA